MMRLEIIGGYHCLHRPVAYLYYRPIDRLAPFLLTTRIVYQYFGTFLVAVTSTQQPKCKHMNSFGVSAMLEPVNVSQLYLIYSVPMLQAQCFFLTVSIWMACNHTIYIAAHFYIQLFSRLLRNKFHTISDNQLGTWLRRDSVLTKLIWTVNFIDAAWLLFMAAALRSHLCYTSLLFMYAEANQNGKILECCIVCWSLRFVISRMFLLFSVPTCHKEPNCELILPAGRVTDSSDPRVVSDDCTDHWVHLQNICYDGKQ